MKTATQVVASLLSLGTLLGMAMNSYATDIADLPLKASVLAKPNVIFGMDDSGSMDWEVLFDTDSGQTYWREDSGTGFGSAWDTAAKRPFRTGVGFFPLSYLFPMGTGTGGALYSSTNENGRSAPPIAQLAWLRSSAFNPLYYNTKVTYPAWSPAYVSGAVRTYANAPTNAAPSHPGPLGSTPAALNVGAEWNSSSTNWSANADNDFTFRVLSGMLLPVGTRVIATTSSSGICSGNLQTLTAVTKVPAGASCRASIPYYPATFWQRTVCPAGDASCVAAPDCAVVSPTTDPNSACVDAPDGTGKLRRYEIKSGNTFPSNRSYADELANFANWFTYFRKRKLMLAASMGSVLENITGLRMDVMPFNKSPTLTMYDADATTASSNRLAVSGQFYLNAMSAEGTPTHATVKRIAGQFEGNSNVVKYACQPNNMFIVTDGFSNTTSISTPSWDSGKSANTWGSTAPYQSIPSGSLADLALRYYTNRLRTDLSAGKVRISPLVDKDDVPIVNPDRNPDLHINTYAITLGVRGSLWPNTVDPFVTAPTWPTPVADDPSMIDDQWHATINGRGQMYLATSPKETKEAIQKGLDAMKGEAGAQGGVAVSTVNLSRGNSRAYFGGYDPIAWAGDLKAYPIETATGVVKSKEEKWSASKKLAARDWTTRIIATSDGSSGMAFTAANVASLVNPGQQYGANAAVIDYLRGDPSGELAGTFRNRKNADQEQIDSLGEISLMGAVINSEPLMARDENVVYVASGEGMLHAFDSTKDGADEGKELWAFVPHQVLPNIGKTVERGYAFHSKLDGSPVVGKYSSTQKLLVAGMGVAGNGYYALDVTNPRGLSEAGLASKWKWQFPALGDSAETKSKVGQTLGRPVIVKSANTTDGYVVLVTSGYNSTYDGKGRLWILNASTGAVIKEFEVAAGTLGAESGLAQVAAFGESDGTVRYVYGGDLLGNLWRFDLKDKGDPFKVATLVGPNGATQPVTAAPELLFKDGQRIVLVGTGRLLHYTDFATTAVQSIYAIADGTTLVNARNTLLKQTYVRGASPALDTLTGSSVDNWATQRGWYIDLPAREQINTRPTLAYGGLAFVSNINGVSDCSASSYLYVVDVLSGKKLSGADFVSSLIGESNSSGVTALSTTGIPGQIVGTGQDADGIAWKRDIIKGGVISPAKNSWLEIRR